MSAHIDERVNRKENGRDQRGGPKPLVGPFDKGKTTPYQDRCAGYHQNESRPSHFRACPEPVTFGMKRPILPDRGIAKDGEDRLEITEPDASPGRRSDEPERIVKNQPAEICRDRTPAASK